MLIFSGVFVLCLKRSNPGSFLQIRSGKIRNIPPNYAKNVKFRWNFAKIKWFCYELVIGRTRFGWGVGRENHRVCSWKSGFTSCRARKTFYWMRTMHRNTLGTVWGPCGREGRAKKSEKSMKFGQNQWISLCLAIGRSGSGWGVGRENHRVIIELPTEKVVPHRAALAKHPKTCLWRL